MADVLPLDESRYRLAMATAGTGMATASLGGYWQTVNPALCRMLGRPADEILGRPVEAFIHPDDIGAAAGSREQVLRALAEDVVATDLRYLGAGGDSIDVNERLVAIRDDAGNPQGLLMHVQVVGEQRRLERELRELQESFERCVEERTEALEAASRRWESFAYGMSHDLRAPLRAINGFASHLERHAGPVLDQAGLDSLKRIRAASERMGGLIDSLLELSRIGRVDLRPEWVDISMLAEWSAVELQEGKPQRRANVSVQPGLEVIGDERLLKTLLTQLLCNCWQFIGADAEVHVDVTGARTPNGLQFTVRDQGLGFDMTYAGKLFEPFQRLHGSDEGAGNGLGLSIAQQIATRHGGRMWAEASPGEGAAFHVTLVDLTAPERTT